mmetsp:Transcript_683/g.1162  ORF Transcript_683/g.1162 Transcript_683/m.1162 type:complete len:490 (+) Transcript_683:198-1667(+)|eukprot:CAMPEP_0201667620 /NCGR_PEP_ID=MMETSP0494-20130426/15872_1 /ASSEMBLY_ACC=CAM_ASM_000839 /TAXON_ID=420259 /ORGANISM="Thalassiosira gravida, Strain GMp14c1" /LENGTH=489 /DNA_ID=CAMNT_0048147669 /DNA_START=142 /DNA_END=1611 /DNA_ORIENTATION=-
MMDDGDDRAERVGFPLDLWDTNGGTENTDSNPNGVGHDSADLLQELSQLAMEEVGNVCGCDLPSVLLRVGSPFLFQVPCDYESIRTNNEYEPRRDSDVSRNECVICNMVDLRQRNNVVRHYMGSMAQCRGGGGDALREAGAVNALLSVLWRLIVTKSDTNNSDCSPVALLPTTKSEPILNGPAMMFDLENLCNNHLHLRSIDPSFDVIVMNELGASALDHAISCLGSLRDLSCGSALNRAAVLAWTPPSPARYDTQCIENGVHVLSAYVNRYDKFEWEDILYLKEREFNMISPADEIDSKTPTDRGKRELRLLTNTLGAIRNTSHSTPDVCQDFFNYGLVDLLVWRLTSDDTLRNTQSTKTMPSSSLPGASRPWREACFRAAGSLINLAEKCPDVAYRLGSNRRFIYLLIEAWGGARAVVFDPNKTNKSTRGLPLLHLGLAAILYAAGNGALEGGLDDVMMQVLEKEKMRKRVAQTKEEERKCRQAKHK